MVVHVDASGVRSCREGIHRLSTSNPVMTKGDSPMHAQVRWWTRSSLNTEQYLYTENNVRAFPLLYSFI